MRAFIVAAAILATAQFTSVAAQTAAQSAPAAHAGYSTADTDIGTLLDDPAARAVIDKHIPGFSSGEQIDMARGMTLKFVQQYAPDKITDQVLAAIDAELAKLPLKR